MAASSCCQRACTSPRWCQPNPNEVTVENHTCTSKLQYETVSRRKKLPKHFQEFRRNRLSRFSHFTMRSLSPTCWSRGRRRRSPLVVSGHSSSPLAPPMHSLVTGCVFRSLLVDMANDHNVDVGLVPYPWLKLQDQGKHV